MRPPIFYYPSHLIAHPAWEQKARVDFISTVAAALARYRLLPLNAFERVQLITTRGSLKRSARAVQLFGRLAVLETHTLRY